MDITEVRIKLNHEPQERLLAFCSITFDDCFVIRDLKIIKGAKGPFVAMPSRKLMDRCPRCHTKNNLRSLFCSQCGTRLRDDRALKDTEGRARLYADIAHPINSECRETIQQRVIVAFEQECVLAQQPGYVCRYDDFGEESGYSDYIDDVYENSESNPQHSPPATIPMHRVDSEHAPSMNGPHRPQQTPTRVAGIQQSSAEHRDEFGTGIV